MSVNKNAFSHDTKIPLETGFGKLDDDTVFLSYFQV